MSFTTAFRVDRIGLTPAYECFDARSNAWRYYGKTTLRNRIVNGRTER